MAKKADKKLIEPNWHPNFVDAEELPDIKLVRTDFFVNIAAIALALICVVLFIRHEVTVYGLKSEIEVEQANIEANKAENIRYSKLDTEYKELAGKLEEVTGFMKHSFEPSEMLLSLTKHVPEEIVLENITMSVDTEVVEATGKSKKKETIKRIVVGVGGVVSGNPSVSNQIVGDFQKQLRSDPVLSENLEEQERAVSLKVWNRLPETEGFQFLITLTYKPLVEKKKPAAKKA